MNLLDRLSSEIIVCDGGMGTMLQSLGLPPHSPPEVWNLSHPQKIKEIHKAYINAGAQIITTNTFGANRAKLKEFGLEKEIKAINQSAVKIAKSACNYSTIIGGSIGPTGKFLKPFGELEFDTAYEIFREQASYLRGVDVIIIETMIDTLELKAAILGVRDATSLPIIAQFSFNEGTRTVTGTPAEVACSIFDSLRVSIFGANCGSTLQDAYKVVQLMAEQTSSPLIIQPNAGIGEKIVSPTEFAQFAIKFVEAGANIVGSCCGSTPEHTKHIANAVHKRKPVRRHNLYSSSTRIASRTHLTYIGKERPVLIVGERINPSGKPWLSRAMEQRDIESIKSDAIIQVEKGAQVLDINTGKYNHQLMVQIFEELQKAIQVPLFIDSQDPIVIEETLKVYGGKGVVNSVTGKEEICHKILPIVKRYGAAVVGLTIDKHGIPETPQARLGVAKKIINIAKSYGISEYDVIIDPLVLPISTYREASYITLEALRRIKKELNVTTILGISNISYGLPGRNFINQAFLSSAIQTGVDAVIIDPCAPHIIELIRGAEFLAGKDREGRRYISMFTTPTVCKSTLHPLQKAILMGDKNEVTKQLHKLLESNIQPLKIIDEYLIPGIEEAGERYERKEIFLPQLIGASETMKWGISLIIPFLEKKKRRGKKILLATVEGDLHDLGKNLVKVILEANGYEVIDLGKDAKPTYIAEVCKKEKPNIVGLSCLMTTTLPSLESTVRYLKKECPHIKIIVGGASVDEEFANRIDVFYAKDAIKAVKLLKTIEGT